MNATLLREAHRVLKPGGLLLDMELPPNKIPQPCHAFYLDWNSFYNNEPRIRAHCAVAPVSRLTNSGCTLAFLGCWR